LPRRLKVGLLIAVSATAVLAALMVNPVAQDATYHAFADDRSWIGIRNFWNVASNVLFAIAGAAGLWVIGRTKLVCTLPGLAPAMVVFYSGVLLTAFGSAWYHLNPGNASLFWDRLPMTIAFMGFFAVIIGEQVSLRVARALFFPLLIIGAASVMYWSLTESQGAGDLRLYGLVQFLPMILVPMMLLLFCSSFDRTDFLWGMIAIYVLAKVAESNDWQIYELGIGLSGHSLKHLIAAVAPLLFLWGTCHRQLVREPS
jgi:hypothetical protein